jgi:hypothetical protein
MIDAQVEPRKRTNYRQRNLHSEVMVPLAWTLIGSGFIGVLLAIACFALGWAWEIAAFITLAAAAGLWFTFGGMPFLDSSQLVESIEEFAGMDLNGNNVIGPLGRWAVKGELTDHQHRTLYSEFELDKPSAFHALCKAVVAGDCHFSRRAAARAGMTPHDIDAIFVPFERRGWLVSEGERKTPRLHGEGKAWVKAFATTPPPVAGGDWLGETGTDSSRQQQVLE